MILDLLNYRRVDVLTDHKLLEVADGEAALISEKFKKTRIDVDSVVMPIGLNPEKELCESLLGRIPNLYIIAGANKVRNIIDGIWDAYEAARAI